MIIIYHMQWKKQGPKMVSMVQPTKTDKTKTLETTCPHCSIFLSQMSRMEAMTEVLDWLSQTRIGLFSFLHFPLQPKQIYGIRQNKRKTLYWLTLYFSLFQSFLFFPLLSEQLQEAKWKILIKILIKTYSMENIR